MIANNGRVILISPPIPRIGDGAHGLVVLQWQHCVGVEGIEVDLDRAMT
jgi:hypothetical protein